MTSTVHLVRWSIALLLALFTSTVQADGPPRVMVSVKPIHSLVAGILEGVAESELIVTDGSPWDYQPTPEQQVRLQQADLVIWVGPELESALAGVVHDPAMRGRSLELLAQDELKVLPARGREGFRDPFFWLDSRNMLILLDELTRVLSEMDPARAHRYQDNRQKVLAAISQTDRELEFGYKDVSSVPVFLYQDTQQYFEQAYAMKAAGIVAAPPGGQSDTATLLKIKSLLKEAKAPCLLAEAGLPAPHLQLLVAGTGARVVELASLGTELAAGPDLYIRLMRDHYQAISNCVRSGPSEPKPVTAAAGTEPPVELFSHRIQVKYLLMNQFGETVSNLDFPGRYQLIYFGYTFCPDVCPTSLVSMGKALELLGPKAERIQPLLITVDPARDTLEVLRRYTAYFHPRLLGLTGSDEMIARTAEQFHVRYEKVLPEEGDPEKYSMDHSASLFLLGPSSEFIAKFAYGLPPKELAARLDELIGD